MKTLPILSRHSSLTAAVKASGIDLSYNEPLALSDLARMDKGNLSHSLPTQPVTEAFVVVEDGQNVVYYVLQCDLALLNKYSPFVHCIHDGAFSFAAIQSNAIVITDGITSDRKAIKAA